ncbi:putative membrane transport protein [Mucinivorans hirudinis]|uniref:Putative membrane transport protein n=1 Tax=Mucinivorans hirudinis TaxID=1433126 RepID=A0A060RD20_9BACT|nr:putative membrane transport protein [Mucinivorans hirudinis]
MQFRKLNTIVGWAVFVIAAITYLLTIEPTASLWDCPEFIATSYKLEVGHPPGTPFFFLINRFAAMFAPDPTWVAALINGFSALQSAFTILFLFWSISHLGRRIYRKRADEMGKDETIAVLGAAAIGSLAYTFSDTFWFSAVEAEVYALSSLFTALVFWAILKWEDAYEKDGGNRWIILIAYLMGLSIGAHILNLLAIPAIAFIFYFKKYPNRKKTDLWKPALASLLLLGFSIKLNPWLVGVSAFIDRIFVNNFDMPVNSGVIFTVSAVLVIIGYFVWRTHKQGKVLLNTGLLSLGLMILGMTTYGIVLIRASVNPPMNSNHPADPYTLERFLNREQYGAPPLVKGQTFASTPIGNNESSTYVLDDNGKYVYTETAIDYKYDPATEVFFPRMHSDKESHIREYKNWTDFKGKQVLNSKGEYVTIPTFAENLKFFFGYQVNNMYWRYFLWNFVGRQSDIQYDGITNGNWLSGIPFIDALYLGPQDNLPSEMAANKGRNKYYFLPFILGLLGLFFHLKRDGRNFTVVMMLFLLTGLAIIVYLNQKPLEPRERDYAYAGSFYAFAIWVGLGVLPIYEWIRKKLNARMAAIVAVAASTSVPVLMATQNWDDHDRSGRTIARDMGYNYLNSTLPNSILFNHGDNDTFPVWYIQEVEGYRTDVRPMNTSYITGDWYIDQMRVKANDSEPLPITIPRSKYRGPGANLVFPIVEIPHPNGGVWTAKEVMAVVNSDNAGTKVEGYDFIPTRRIAIPVNKENVLKSGIVKPEMAHMIEDTIYVTIPASKRSLHIGELVQLDLLANSDWLRPIYTTGSTSFLDLGLVVANKNEKYSYLQQNGANALVVPFKTPIDERMGIGYLDTESLYDEMMNNLRFGNIDNPKVYVDSFVENSLQAARFRETYGRLAHKLLQQGDSVRAIEVVDKSLEMLPPAQLRYDQYIVPMIEAYWLAGATEKGDKLADDFIRVQGEYVEYFYSFKGRQAEAVDNALLDKQRNLYDLSEVARKMGKTDYYDKIKKYF